MLAYLIKTTLARGGRLCGYCFVCKNVIDLSEMINEEYLIRNINEK